MGTGQFGIGVLDRRLSVIYKTSDWLFLRVVISEPAVRSKGSAELGFGESSRISSNLRKRRILYGALSAQRP
jgi:hypothetical protein